MTSHGPDFLEIDRELTDEQRLARDSVRKFVDRDVRPIIAGHFEAGTFPHALIRPIADLGALGANLTGYGCLGADNLTYGLMMAELERGDSALRSFASVQGSLAMYAIRAYGSEAHRERWLPRMAAGEAIGCFGLTEPDFGSNPDGMRTTGVRKGAAFVLNGTKRWITNGTLAEVAIVWARLEGQIRGFVVETNRAGFSASAIEKKMSLRASDTAELHLDDVEVPEDAMLPGAVGLKGPLGCLTQARYGVAWGALGAAVACYQEALDYAGARVQFGRPIAGFQLVQQKLVHMLDQITYSQLLLHRLARLKDAGTYTPAQVSLAKRHCVRAALEGARTTRDILGASGISLEYSCARHMMNLESVSTYEGTHDIHTLILGQKITGLAAFE